MLSVHRSKFPLKVLSTLLKTKIKFSSYIRKFGMEQLQWHKWWLTASSDMGKYLRISSYIRKPFLIYDFATAPLWISLYTRKIWFSFLSVLWKQRGVETSINRSIVINCLAGKCHFRGPIYFRHHHEGSINVFSVFGTFWHCPNRVGLVIFFCTFCYSVCRHKKNYKSLRWWEDKRCITENSSYAVVFNDTTGSDGVKMY